MYSRSMRTTTKEFNWSASQKSAKPTWWNGAVTTRNCERWDREDDVRVSSSFSLEALIHMFRWITSLFSIQSFISKSPLLLGVYFGCFDGLNTFQITLFSSAMIVPECFNRAVTPNAPRVPEPTVLRNEADNKYTGLNIIPHSMASQHS